MNSATKLSYVELPDRLLQEELLEGQGSGLWAATVDDINPALPIIRNIPLFQCLGLAGFCCNYSSPTYSQMPEPRAPACMQYLSRGDGFRVTKRNSKIR